MNSDWNCAGDRLYTKLLFQFADSDETVISAAILCKASSEGALICIPAVALPSNLEEEAAEVAVDGLGPYLITDVKPGLESRVSAESVSS